MKRVPAITILIAAATLLLLSNISAQTRKEDKVIKNGSLVSLEYTRSDDKGKPIESNQGEKPLAYTHGQGQLIPGLEKELLGMKVGGTKNVRVKPDDAYGLVDPKAFREVARDKVPPEALKVGATLVARDAQGLSLPVRVHEVKEKTVILDFNHPLAGKMLSFDIKILEVKTAPTGK